MLKLSKLDRWACPFMRDSLIEVTKRQPDIPVYEWMSQEGFSSGGNRFMIEKTPYLIEPFEAYKDNVVIGIVLACPAQSGKTVYSEGCLAYSSAVEKGDSLFYANSKKDVSDFFETRMSSHYQKLPSLRRKKQV